MALACAPSPPRQVGIMHAQCAQYTYTSQDSDLYRVALRLSGLVTWFSYMVGPAGDVTQGSVNSTRFPGGPRVNSRFHSFRWPNPGGTRYRYAGAPVVAPPGQPLPQSRASGEVWGNSVEPASSPHFRCLTSEGEIVVAPCLGHRRRQRGFVARLCEIKQHLTGPHTDHTVLCVRHGDAPSGVA